MTDEYIIGIDLGTTYTCAAVMRNNKIEVIPVDLGKRLTPSYVSFKRNVREIGEAAKLKSLSNLKNTIYSIKRIIGRNYSDEIVQKDIKLWPFKVIKDSLKDKSLIEVEYRGEKKQFYPQQISAMILGHVKKYAEEYMGTEIKKAVITVPAYFNEAQKKATKEAGEIAGLEVIRILNEPTAAAIAYGYGINEDINDKKNILIFDLGGGTYDISILQLKKNKFTVLSINGDTHLGGDDFDNAFVQFCIKLFKNETSIDISKIDISDSERAINKLKIECQKYKEQLSISEEVDIEIDSLAEKKNFYSTIRRADFEFACKDLFDKLIPPIKEALNDAKLKKEDIDDIVLVGGSSRIPKIQEMLSKYFNNKQLTKKVNPDEIVAEGAAMQASILKEKGELQIININPISLGIKSVINGIEGCMNFFIKKNIQLPYINENSCFTICDNQTEICFPVYQGEKEFVKDNYFLNDFTISGLRKAPKGEVKFNVKMELDENGILKVTANEINGNHTGGITIEGVNDFTKEQIEFFKKQEKELQNEDKSKKR